jgi:hypothetical protein
MSKPLGIVPLYYGVGLHPNDRTIVHMPAFNFARAEIASRSKEELTELVARLDQELREGRSDLFHLKCFWEMDFGGKKAQDSLTIDDLELAVKGKLSEEGRKVVAEIPAYNLIRVAAFDKGELEFQQGRRGASQSVSHRDLLSVSIKGEESGVSRNALKYWQVTVRAPFVQREGDGLKISDAYELRCQCLANQKAFGKDTRVPSRTIDVVCSHGASAVRELYLEQAGLNEKRIRKLDDPSLERGDAVMMYSFFTAGVSDLAMEALAMRYAFGMEIRDIDNYLRDQDIFHEQFEELRKSGQARIEAVKSTQNFPSPYGGVKEQMITALDQKGYEFVGYGYDFRGTEHQTVALVYQNPKTKRIAHIIFDSNLEKPYFLFKFAMGDSEAERFGTPAEALEGHPVANINKPFVHTDDMFGEEKVGVIISPATVLTGTKQKELYQE